MKLLKQTTLYFQQGNSDKVYEVDLCEVGAGQFVVNFRYGRRGANLRDGTKTVTAVSRKVAENLFEDLVNSKTSKGYVPSVEEAAAAKEAGNSSQPSLDSTNTDANENPVSKPDDPRTAATLARILKGPNDTTSKWKFSRAVWRAGELGLKAAAPEIVKHVGIDEMTDYCIVWALGRLQSKESFEFLDTFWRSKRPAHLTQIAREAMRMAADETKREQLIEQVRSSLPSPLDQFSLSANSETFAKALHDRLQQDLAEDADLLSQIYFVDNEITRPALLHCLHTTPFKANSFRGIRRVFKAAELRRDGETFGVLARRFEIVRTHFRIPTYRWRGYQMPTLGDNATRAFSVQSRYYFRRRTWTTLKTLGEIGSSDYVGMATGVLLAFSDADASTPRQSAQYNYELRQYRHVHWDEFGGYWAFNQILNRNSPRYQILSGKNTFCLSEAQKPDTPKPNVRGEAFPELWEKQPKALLHLLMESECLPVHEFAARTLKDCSEFCNGLELGLIKQLLVSSYEPTIDLAFEIAKRRYDASNPDVELVLMLANCPLSKARETAHRWIDENQRTFVSDQEFVFGILTSNFSDSRNCINGHLDSMPASRDNVRVLSARLIAFLLELGQGEASGEVTEQPADTETPASNKVFQLGQHPDADLAADIGKNLSRRYFADELTQIGEQVIVDLLSSPLPEVQVLAGDIIQRHRTLSRNPKASIIGAFLQATHPPVRAVGVKLIADLPDHSLKQNRDLLVQLTCHPFEDIRNEIRPRVQRLTIDSSFAKQLASDLIERLLTPGSPDGVPTHLSTVIREDCAKHLSHISEDTVWNLLQSRSGPAQQVGGFLLPTNVDPDSLTVPQVVKLASHDILTVREAARKWFKTQTEIVRGDLPSAVRILDSKWDDTRQFGFEYFRTETKEDDLTPETLISICDSVREDVQQFGREMITRRFREDDGPQYLTKISEHPSADLQLFASNYLVQYGSDNLERLEQLTPYFISILSRVNQGRVAKDRVLGFLAEESKRGLEFANLSCKILARISATCAIGDRAKTIEAMVLIHDLYPDKIPMPLQVKPLAVKG